MRTVTKVALSVSGVVVLLVAGVLAVGGYLFYEKLTEGSISKKTYDAIRVGDGQAEVVGKLPNKQSGLARSGIDKETPAPPKGATCRYHAAEIDSHTDSHALPVYRFCFTHSKLVQKTTLG